MIDTVGGDKWAELNNSDLLEGYTHKPYDLSTPRVETSPCLEVFVQMLPVLTIARFIIYQVS